MKPKHPKPTSDDLAIRCRKYLEDGPPAEMTDYVPGSMTEIIIGHGAKELPVDAELQELGELVAMELEQYDAPNPKVTEYMKRGGQLVKEILNRQTS